MRIINYGHSCFKIIDDGVSVIFDPYQDDSVPGLQLPNDLEADYVFCSHDHADHNAVDKVKLTGRTPELNMKSITLNHDSEGGKLRGKTIARILYFKDYSICHLGDAGDVNEIADNDEFDDIDIVLAPINGFYTICALDALLLKRLKNWKLLIPMHYQKRTPGGSSGYTDGHQITILVKSVDRFLEFEKQEIEIQPRYFDYNYLIFK